MNRDRKAYRRAYYLAHREEEIKAAKIYGAAHPDMVKKSKKKYALSHKEERKKYARGRTLSGIKKMESRRYYSSEKGRHMHKLKQLNYVASGRNAVKSKERRVLKKAYEQEIFADAPNKRIQQRVKTMVVLSDLQIPFEDPDAVNQALEVIEKVQPDTIVLNGDIVDCYAESSFLKDFNKVPDSIRESHIRARNLMELLKDIPNKIWLGGNHEYRWTKILWAEMANRPTLGPICENLVAAMKERGDEIDLRDPDKSFEKIYDMQKYGFRYYPWGHRLYVAEGNLVITHGKYVSRHSGYSAKRTWEWLGKSCIVGHTHRLGSYLVTQDGVENGAWENGCLCNLEPEYDDAPNWQQGFSVVKVEGETFHVVVVPIVRRGGKALALCDGLGAL